VWLDVGFVAIVASDNALHNGFFDVM
jgi:hypothetical protein